jgi:hypothetical protein
MFSSHNTNNNNINNDILESTSLIEIFIIT